MFGRALTRLGRPFITRFREGGEEKWGLRATENQSPNPLRSPISYGPSGFRCDFLRPHFQGGGEEKLGRKKKSARMTECASVQASLRKKPLSNIENTAGGPNTHATGPSQRKSHNKNKPEAPHDPLLLNAGPKKKSKPSRHRKVCGDTDPLTTTKPNQEPPTHMENTKCTLQCFLTSCLSPKAYRA